jgi:hypothetical protein
MAESKASAADVAAWMLKQLQSQATPMYQEVSVRRIRERFGDEFTYRNANGNPAISKAVLAAFRKLSGR